MSSHAVARPSQLLGDLFPGGVVGYELRGHGETACLLPEEWPLVERASAKRVREFAAGRMCARAALEQFGVAARPLAVGEDRSAQWPSGFCGSISHTNGYCVAAVGERTRYDAIGVDVELLSGMTAEVWPQICARTEIEWLESLPRDQRAGVAALIFSAKETFYKCQYAATQQWLDFNDVTVDLMGWELGAGSFAIRPLGISKLLQQRPLPWPGRFRFSEGMVVTGMVLPVL